MKTDDVVYLYPVPQSHIGGQLRSKTQDEQKISFQKGQVVTSKATIALLHHGFLYSGRPEATLLILDLRFVTSDTAERLIHGFRDA